jgi:hypothetical protein
MDDNSAGKRLIMDAVIADVSRNFLRFMVLMLYDFMVFVIKGNKKVRNFLKKHCFFRPPRLS